MLPTKSTKGYATEHTPPDLPTRRLRAQPGGKAARFPGFKRGGDSCACGARRAPPHALSGSRPLRVITCGLYGVVRSATRV